MKPCWWPWDNKPLSTAMSRKILVGSIIGIFIFTFLPNVPAFFTSNAARSASKWSSNNLESPLASSRSSRDDRLSAAPMLLADPMPNSIGNFFENKTDGMSFIQCYMLSVAVVGGQQYGTTAWKLSTRLNLFVFAVNLSNCP